jgi:hypothetical protein
MDTDINHAVVKETDPAKRRELTTSTWQDKRTQMKNVCTHCHTENYVDAFYKQYDDFIVLYNEKFAKPAQKIITVLREQKLLTPQEFDEKIEWTWFLLWHHEGRRARHGAAMMAPDYAHWHGMYEVAPRFYQELIPEAREIAQHAEDNDKQAEADAVRKVIDDILARPEHKWFESGGTDATPQTRPPPSSAPVGNINPTGTGDSPLPKGKADSKADSTKPDSSKPDSSKTANGKAEKK